MYDTKRFHWPTRPEACRENIVLSSNCRFTVLTSRLIRMEYSPMAVFEDRPSQSVFYRDFPEVPFIAKNGDGVLILETEALRLTCRTDKKFSADTLSVALKQEPASCWHYGEDFEELGGTTQTLDGVNGAIPLQRGVCSRYGFSVLDDSETMVLGEDDWVAVRTPGTKDLYFFGYGYDYIGAVQDFYRLTGAPSMLPAYALGNWWSRYYPYTQQEYLDLMERFREEDIPFSVGVVDMDWHLVNIPEEYHDENDPMEGDGWTGYTWNEELFPDYKAFLKELKKYHLHTALNLHPASGVRRFDSMYEEMAKACGVDPACGKRIPFDILSPEFMANYFDILHHPYEEDGVDFWWMDWQQGNDYSWIHEPNRDGKLKDEREILKPLWMLNHLHILDIMRNGKRPMFFSRYAGPGSHRYPVGFSGDSVVTWQSLKFQPYFTATASNIGYSWWSHDIGGHMWGYRDDELTLRWVQLGVLSPVNRLHSSCDLFQHKEPWAFDSRKEAVLKKWLRLRHSLFPYLYTMNYRNHSELLPLVQPMYYSHPKCSGAYEVPGQFWFGSELFAAAITEKSDGIAQMSKTEAWLPAGNWFDFFNGARYASRRGRKMEICRTLEEYPVFAKAGAIVPMAEHEAHDNVLQTSSALDVIIFPGADNRFTLYEDEGDYNNFEHGAYVKTDMSLSWGGCPKFEIEPPRGDASLFQAKRTWTLKFRGFHKCVEAHVTVNGEAYEAETFRVDSENTLCVRICAPGDAKITVALTGEEMIHDNCDAKERYFEILQRAQVNYGIKNELWKTLLDSRCIHEKMFTFGSVISEYPVLTAALKEQMTLTEDEFLGREW